MSASSSIERIEQASAPPIAGCYYSVPTVRAFAWGQLAHWPVLGVRHEDGEHLGLDLFHFHVDIRFLNRRLTEAMKLCGPPEVQAARHVLSDGDIVSATGERRWLPMRCYRASSKYPRHVAGAHQNFRALWAAYAGRECNRGKAGLVCPHRNFPLGSVGAINGVITCPLHGLLIDAESGRVLPLDPHLARAAA